MAKFSDMSDVVLAEIMSWLPPESLLRFTCVQKSWHILIKDLIKNPIFVAKHLNNSKNGSTSSLVFRSSKIIKMGCLTLYNDEDNKQHLTSAVEDLTPLQPLLPKHDAAFRNVFATGISHCNGILCLVDYVKYRFLLCNPATRETKLLPGPYYPGMIVAIVGLGYDCTANVYKVVRVSGWSGHFKAQVCTLGDDTWRDIMLDHVEISDDYSVSAISHVCCKGFYYWLVRKYGSPNQKIIYSFDMHNEVFQTIFLPDIVQSIEYRSTYDTSLTEWNESVVVFCYPGKHFVKTKPIEMWVMHKSFEDNKNSQCWTKHLSVGPEGIYKSPSIFLNSEELLITAFEKGIISYNIRTSKVRRIFEGNEGWIQVVRYVKSLVSVNGNTAP